MAEAKPSKYCIAAHIRWQSPKYRQNQAAGMKAANERRKAETERLRARVAELEKTLEAERAVAQAPGGES